MSLFDMFPYTSNYGLNLDWIIQQIVTMKAAYDQLDADSFLRKNGGVMDGAFSFGANGSLNMGGRPLTGVKTAVSGSDAVPLNQAETTYFKKSGGPISGDVNMSGNKISGLANATQADDAVNKAQADSSYVAKSGDTMSGALNMAGNKITNIPMPSADKDAASKEYVDERIGTPEKPGAYLPLAGGTLSGALNMANNAIRNLPEALSGSDAVPYGQAQKLFFPISGGSFTGPVAMEGNSITGLPAASANDSPVTLGQANNSFERLGMVQEPVLSITSEADLNSNINTLFTRMPVNSIQYWKINQTNSFVGFGSSVLMQLYKESETEGFCIFYSSTNFSEPFSIAMKNIVNSQAQSLLWINPVMSVNTPYRTCFMYAGRSVYMALLNGGQAQNGKVLLFNSIPGLNVGRVFAHIGMLNDSFSLPYAMIEAYVSGGTYAESYVQNSANIGLRCGGDFVKSSYIWNELIFWY